MFHMFYREIVLLFGSMAGYVGGFIPLVILSHFYEPVKYVLLVAAYFPALFANWVIGYFELKGTISSLFIYALFIPIYCFCMLCIENISGLAVLMEEERKKHPWMKTNEA